MEPQLTDKRSVVFLLIVLFSAGSSENDLYWNFCGTWRHGKDALSLSVDLSPGCDNISISANKSSLSISGKITAQCNRSEVILLNQFGLDPEKDSDFCLYWQPLLDQLMLRVGEKSLTLCWPASLRDSCCTDLTHGANAPEAQYGIKDGMIENDPVTTKILKAYNFRGHYTNCKALCDQASNGSSYGNMLSETVMKLKNIEHPCGHRSVVEMKETSKGYNVTSPDTIVAVYLPPALKDANPTNKVACTFYKNNSLFQEGYKKVKILNDVVEITVENEVIADLSEPIKITFHHDVILKYQSRRCVSWDTRKDPLLVNWLVDGCETHQKGPKHTECLCNHLTYFTVLVELEPEPVRHLMALTVITSLGCAASAISSIALITYLCRKRGRSKEQSIHIHLGLALSLAFLSLLFFFTGVLANVGGEHVCVWVGAILHYALLSSFAWMGIEVFHTFWLVYMVFSPPPKPYIWNLVGFVLPAVPVIILVAVGNIYGVREVESVDDISGPYLMCWMQTSPTALLAHHVINGTIVAVLVLSGIVMLFLVYKKIRPRDEWNQNGVAFLSIWGLSCLFGTAWGLPFMKFGPVTDLIRFLACILTAFQGFFLMLRFYMLSWMRRQASGSALGSTSSGSTRQHMLQPQDKS